MLAAAAALARAWGPVERASDFLWRDLLDCSFDLDRKFQITDACHRGRTALDELGSLVSGLVSGPDLVGMPAPETPDDGRNSEDR